MALQARVGWRAYTPSLVSTLLTSLYGVWNGDTSSTTLGTSVYNAWNGELLGTTQSNSLDSGVYLSFNGAISGTSTTDVVGSNNGTLVNGATSGTGFIGTSLSFDGVNDYVELPANSLNSITSEFSISMWLKVASNTSGYQIFAEQTRTTNNNITHELDRGIRILYQGGILIFTSNNGADFTVSANAAAALSVGYYNSNTWYHYTFTYKQGVGAYIYVNGILLGSTTTANALTRTSNNIPRLGVGKYYSNGATVFTSYLNGGIDGFTIWNRQLDSTEASKLFNGSSGISYPYSNKTLYGAYDLVNSINGTSSGVFHTGVSLEDGLLSKSFKFNGGQFLTLPDNSLSSLISGDFSISFWVNHTQTGVNTTTPLCYMSNPSTNVYNGFEIVLSGLIPQFKIYPNAALASAVQLNSATSISANNWHHIVVTRKSGTRSIIYINGVQSSSNTSTSNPTVSGTFLATIGKQRYAAVSQYSFVNGTKMDGITTWTKELTADEVTQLYNIGGGIQYPFTTQTIKTPYSVYNGDNLVDPIGAKNATINGGVTYTTGKIGNAYTFNGTTGYLTLPVGSLNLAGSFSFSMWLKFNGTPANYSTIISNLLTANYRGFQLAVIGGKLYIQLGNGSGIWVELQGPLVSEFTNKWGHVTFVWEQGVGMKFYLNGVLNNSGANTTTLTYAGITAAPMIGKKVDGGWSMLNGSIDGLTFWNSALTLPEISTLYNDGNGMEYPYSSSIVAKLPSASDAYSTNNGTLMNGCTFTTGKIGKAFNFDGVNDYVSLPNNSMNFTGSSFSVSFWMNLTNINTSNYALVSNYANDGTHRGWIVGSFTSGKLYFGIYSPSLQETSTTASISINTWYHVVCVYTPSQPTKTYINGVLDSTSSTSYNPSFATTHYPTIGASKYNVSSVQQYMPNGSKIDAVSVWQKALTASEVTELYNSGNGKQYPNF